MENADFFRVPRKGWTHRAIHELIFNQIMSFKTVFNLVTLMT